MAAGTSSVDVWLSPISNQPNFFTVSATGANPDGVQFASGAMQTPNLFSTDIVEKHLAAGYCYPVTLKLTNGGGFANNSPQSTTIHATGAFGGTFHSDPSCDVPSVIAGGNVNFSAAEFFKIIYFKPTGSGPGSMYGTISGPATNLPTNIDVAVATVASFRLVRIDNNYQGSSFYNPNECMMARLEAHATNEALVKVPADVTKSLDNQSAPFAFSGDSCGSTSGTKSVTINSGQMMSPSFWVRDFGVAVIAPRLDGILMGPQLFVGPDHFKISSIIGTTQAVQNSCEQINFEMKDSSNGTYTAPINMTARIGLAGGNTLYSEGSCTSVVVLPADIPISSGQSVRQYWIRHMNNSNLYAQAGAMATPTSQIINTFPLVFRFVANQISVNQCVPVRIESMFGDVFPETTSFQINPAVTSGNLVANGNSNYFYTDSGCGTAAPAGSFYLTVNGGQTVSTDTYWIRLQSSVMSNIRFDGYGTGVNSPITWSSMGDCTSGVACYW